MNIVSFFPDQHMSAVQVTTSDMLTDFHTTFKTQIHAMILDSSSTTPSKQTETFYNVKANSKLLKVTSEENKKSSDITSVKNSSQSVLPNGLRYATLQTSTVALHQNDETLNAPLIKILEELDASAVADTEVDTHTPMQASTVATESSTWSSRKFHEVNKIKNVNYLTTLKGPAEITTLSLKDSLEETTFTHPTTRVTLSDTLDLRSEEENAEHSTVLPIKFSTNSENKNLVQEIKLENSIYHQVKNADVYLKMGGEIPISTNRSESEYTKVKRHAVLKDQKGKKIL
jgi:hypothetical protein